MIQKPSTAFPLSHGIKRPRFESPKYLTFIRSLPCVVTGAPAEAAHVRFGSLMHGKRGTGMGEKPDDYWAIPLSPEEHRLGNASQHAHDEMLWWQGKRVMPLTVCGVLWIAFTRDDREAAELVCEGARTGFYPWL